MAFVYDHTNYVLGTGDVWLNPTSGSATLSLPGTAPIAIAESGLIQGNDVSALALQDGFYAVNNAGAISAKNGSGIYFDTSSAAGFSSVKNAASGTISGGNEDGNSGVYSNHALNITNAGMISGYFGISIVSGAGTTTIYNSGIITAPADAIRILGAAKAIINNSGSIVGSVFIDSAKSVITNTGTIVGGVALSDFADRLTNSGNMLGLLDMGKGNDFVRNTGAIASIVQMGDGNDRYFGSGGTDHVSDAGGADTYRLGDGTDTFLAVSVGSDSTNGNGKLHLDFVDGGATADFDPDNGNFGDVYDALAATGSVFVNLDSKAHTDRLTGIQVGKAMAEGGGIGNDRLNNFEAVHGGEYDDIIFGDRNSNYFEGRGGHDHLHGGGGKDTMFGGTGSDHYFGDAGADILIGGYDGEMDIFYYLNLADSTNTLAGRDTIRAFEDGVDKLDLSALGMNASWFLGVDVGFVSDTGHGHAHVATTSYGWLLQVDLNGDRSADMSIAVEDIEHNQIDWNGDEFIL